MKKLISVITAMLLTLSMVAMPVFADTTTPAGVSTKGKGVSQKNLQALQNNLDKTKKLLQKATSDLAKIETTIQNEIKKATDKDSKKTSSASKQTTNANAQIEKWQQELDKAAAHDKVELTNLDNDIAKWTAMMETQKSTFAKQKATIQAAYTKKDTELKTKLAAAKDDATKNQLTTAIANLKSYTDQKLAAIDNYLSSLANIWAQRQNVWKERRDILLARQKADMDFRTVMTQIKTAELKDKLLTTPQTTPTPQSNIEASVRAKHQKQIDNLKSKIAQYNDLIQKLEAQIASLKK